MSVPNEAKLVSVPLAGGGSVAIPMLSPAGVVMLAERVQNRRRDQLRDNLRDAGCDPKVMLKHLNTINAVPVRLGDIISPIPTDAWLQACVIELAMKDHPGLAVDLLSMPEKAAELLNLTLTTKEQTADGATPFPDPLTELELSASSTETPGESAPSTT